MYNFILKLDMTITKLIGNNYVSIFYNYLDKEKVDIFFQNITKLGEGLPLQLTSSSLENSIPARIRFC